MPWPQHHFHLFLFYIFGCAVLFLALISLSTWCRVSIKRADGFTQRPSTIRFYDLLMRLEWLNGFCFQQMHLSLWWWLHSELFFFLDWWMFLFVWMIERASGWLFREWRKPNDVKPDDFTFFVLFFLSFLLYRRFISFLIFDIHTPTILVLLHVQFAHHPPRYSWSTSSSYASWSHRISSQASARKWSIRSLSFRYIYISIYHYIDILWTHLRTTCSCGYIRSYPRLVFFLSSSTFFPSILLRLLLPFIPPSFTRPYPWATRVFRFFLLSLSLHLKEAKSSIGIPTRTHTWVSLLFLFFSRV